MFNLDEFSQIFHHAGVDVVRRRQASSKSPPRGRQTSGGTVSDRRLEGTQQANGSSNGHGAGGHENAARKGMGPAAEQAARLSEEWAASPRWRSVRRTFSARDVIRLRGSVQEEHTLARLGAELLWKLLHERDYVHSLGAVTGNQAVQQVRAGPPAIYLSGWQVAADANLAREPFPDPRR